MDAEEAIEDIVVIGSRRQNRTAVDSAVPVDVIDVSELEVGGFSDVNRQLSSVLPSFNYPQPTLVDGTEHIKPASLRGLAPDQTLVLVNGRRRHPSALLNINGSAGRGSVSVDLNGLPSAAIGRIEVLRDGAAAQYGSDAIAGVINLVMKNASEGLEIDVTGGSFYTTLDGVPEFVGVVTDVNGAPVGLNGSTSRLALITGDDVDRQDGETITTSVNWGLPLGERGFLNLTGEYTDANRTNRGGWDDRDTYLLMPNGEFDPREVIADRDRFFVGTPDYESVAVFYNSAYEVGEALELYSFGSSQNRDATSGAFYREASDEASTILDIYPDGFTPRISSEITDFSLAFGGRGEIGGWNWDASFVRGYNKVEYTNSNTANLSLGSATPTTFYGGAQRHTQNTINVDASRLVDVSSLASAVSVAFGFEYREEDYGIESGEPAASTAAFLRDANGDLILDMDGNRQLAGRPNAQGSLYFGPNDVVKQDRDAIGVYAEVDMDVTERWNVVLAARFEDYSDFGDTSNGKVATRFRINDEFALRGSFSTGFRAPSLQQQFFTQTTTNFIGGEPFDILTLPATSPIAQVLGGTQLEAEESTNVSVGLTWSPTDSIDVTLDAYRIEIDDRIVLTESLDAQAVLEAAGFFGVQRARFFINGVDSETDGVDLAVTYRTDLGQGDLSVSAAVNWNETEVSDVIATVGPASIFEPSDLFARRERARLENAAPEYKANVASTWTRGNFGMTLRASQYGETTQPGTTTAADRTVDSALILDAELRYQFSETINGALGANNVLDQYPKSSIELFGDSSSFNYIFPFPGFSPYGFHGRYVYAKLGLNF